MKPGLADRSRSPIVIAFISCLTLAGAAGLSNCSALHACDDTALECPSLVDRTITLEPNTIPEAGVVGYFVQTCLNAGCLQGPIALGPCENDIGVCPEVMEGPFATNGQSASTLIRVLDGGTGYAIETSFGAYAYDDAGHAYKVTAHDGDEFSITVYSPDSGVVLANDRRTLTYSQISGGQNADCSNVSCSVASDQ